jgi:hypothetical protein
MEKLSLSNIKSKESFVFTFEPSDIEKVLKIDYDDDNTSKRKDSSSKVKFSDKIDYIKPIEKTTVKMFDDEFDEVFDDNNDKVFANKNQFSRMSSSSSREFNIVLLLNNHNNKKNRLIESVSIEKHGGLFNKRVFGVFILWYLFSALSLFSNKNILTKYEGNPTVLGCVQMIITTVFGFIQIRLFRFKIRKLLCCRKKSRIYVSISDAIISRFNFWRDIFIVGSLR